MRDPELARSKFLHRLGEFLPIGVVGDDERELDALLARAGSDAHPAAGEGVDVVAEAAGPPLPEHRGWGEDDAAGEDFVFRLR